MEIEKLLELEEDEKFDEKDNEKEKKETLQEKEEEMEMSEDKIVQSNQETEKYEQNEDSLVDDIVRGEYIDGDVVIQKNNFEQYNKYEVGVMNRDRAVKCEECGKILKRRYLAKHLRRNHDSSIKKIPMGNLIVPNQSEIENTLKGLDKCVVCEKVMLKKSLAWHMQRVHEDAAEPKHHAENTQTGDQTVQEVNDFVQSTSAELTDIKKNIEEKDENHEDIKIIKSEYIEVEVDILNEDTEEKTTEDTAKVNDPRECKMCNKFFSTRKNMRRHMFNLHNMR